MSLTAFTCRIGQGQGRLATSMASNGDYAFVLGDIEAGRFFELREGDHSEVTQPVDLTGVAFVRATLRLRAPALMPVGYAWEAQIVIDGAPYARFRSRSGRTRVARDLVANVSKLTGVHDVGARLALVSS